MFREGQETDLSDLQNFIAILEIHQISIVLIQLLFPVTVASILLFFLKHIAFY